MTYGTHVAIGREVCARRARKLRKRGESVRYVGRTTTGKARYSWLRTIAPWAIYMPNVLGVGPPERRSRGGNRQAPLAGGPSRPKC